MMSTATDGGPASAPGLVEPGVRPAQATHVVLEDRDDTPVVATLNLADQDDPPTDRAHVVDPDGRYYIPCGEVEDSLDDTAVSTAVRARHGRVPTE